MLPFPEFHENQVKQALQCWGITEPQAKRVFPSRIVSIEIMCLLEDLLYQRRRVRLPFFQRDTSFESSRTSCARRVLIGRGFIGKQQELSDTHVDDILCHVLTEAVRSKVDWQRYSRTSIHIEDDSGEVPISLNSFQDPRIQFARRVKLCMHEILADKHVRKIPISVRRDRLCRYIFSD